MNFIHQELWSQFKTDFFQNSFAWDIYFWHNVFQWLCIEKLKAAFHFLKEKKNKRKWLLNTFRVCCFGRHEFPMRCIESWTEATKQWWREQETNWLVVCYWFSENVKNIDSYIVNGNNKAIFKINFNFELLVVKFSWTK